ncbi:hypothetical protein Drorol1_Dr00010637 [Drosera rotundifolia]
MTSPNDWFQFYQTDLGDHGSSTSTAAFPAVQSSDAAVASTTMITSSSSNVLSHLQQPPGMFSSSSSCSASSQRLSSDGRVSKPVRRRAKASRKAPTTLLKTDPSNFRAMVQQFTGGPSTPFSGPGFDVSAPSASTQLLQHQMMDPNVTGYRINFEPSPQFPGRQQQPRPGDDQMGYMGSYVPR